MSSAFISNGDRRRIVELALDGTPPRQIRVTFEKRIELDQIYSVLAAARRSGTVIPKFPSVAGPYGTNGRCVLMPTIILDALEAPARQRGITINELCRRLVETIADEGLVDAILDDIPDLAGCAA